MSDQRAMAAFLGLKSELDYVGPLPAVNLRRDRREQTIAALRAWLAAPMPERLAILEKEVIQPALQRRDDETITGPTPQLAGGSSTPILAGLGTGE